MRLLIAFRKAYDSAQWARERHLYEAVLLDFEYFKRNDPGSDRCINQSLIKR